MSALPSSIRTYESIQRQANNWTALVDERAAEIDKDTAKVIGLFMAEAEWLTAQKRGNGHNELIELSVYAMNAWPVFEKRVAGFPVTPDEAMTIPTLFRALRQLIDRRAVIVREAAEDELKAEAIEARRLYRLDNAIVEMKA